MAILAPAMVTIQTAAGTVKETDNGVSFFGVTDLKTGMCSNRAEWVYKLQDKVTEEELAEIVNTIQCVFSIPNRYIKKTYKIQQGTQIAILPTMGLSLLLVGLPSSAIRNSKYPELVQRAYELANKICRDLNKKILKERGVTVSVRQHGMQAGAMFRTSYHLPELHFDFCPQQTQPPPANVVGENILVAELAAWQNLLRIFKKKAKKYALLEENTDADVQAARQSGIKWQYYVGDGVSGKANGWYDYDDDASDIVEGLHVALNKNAVLAGYLARRTVTSGNMGFEYDVDLNQSTQTNTR